MKKNPTKSKNKKLNTEEKKHLQKKKKFAVKRVSEPEVEYEIKYIKSKKTFDESWDFRKSNTKEYTHCFHSYPAMMIPQVARRIIENYGNKSKILFLTTVKKDGFACHVVGNRTVKGFNIPTDEITAELFKGNNFEHIGTIVRNIPNKRMPSKNSYLRMAA